MPISFSLIISWLLIFVIIVDMHVWKGFHILKVAFQPGPMIAGSALKESLTEELTITAEPVPQCCCFIPFIIVMGFKTHHLI